MSLPDYACGITTVEGREELFYKTSNSLISAGFYLSTFRDDSPCLGTFGNWYRTALELYLRTPMADRYIIFQDDLVACSHLRDYLDMCDVSDDAYYNLYTIKSNEKPTIGWSPAKQNGKGAVALMFPNLVLRKLLTCQDFIDRPRNRIRQKKNPCTNLDGGIVDCLKSVGVREFVHQPSLVQHTGMKSTIGHSERPRWQRFKTAHSFMGEDYDARQFIGKQEKPMPRDMRPKDKIMSKPNVQSKAPQKVKRIGLAGFCCQTGLGQVNYATATYAEIDKWLIKPHQNNRLLTPPDTVDATICMGNHQKMTTWLSTIDTLLFFETVVNKGLLELAHRMGKRIVCVPMIEWLPDNPKSWVSMVDLFICPTRQCYDLINAQETPYPSVYFPWPIDTEKFKYRQRTKVEKFLFINGKGGWQGRKGGDVIRKAKELWPEMPLVVVSQSKEDWPEGTEVITGVKDNANLYDVGDILLCPHTVDGLGLEPMEAMATGMPVIVPFVEPWNENLFIYAISTKVTRKKVARVMDWHLCSPEKLVEHCTEVHDGCIEASSEEAREWAESRSWNIKADEFTNLVRTGTPANMEDKV